jgi:transposase
VRAQLTKLEALPDAGPAAFGWVEDHRWTLAWVTELVRDRFGVDYMLAGMGRAVARDRLERAGSGPAAAERDETAIAAWREEAWPVVKAPRRTCAPGSVSKTNLARA